jgi:hypothetical protein
VSDIPAEVIHTFAAKRYLSLHDAESLFDLLERFLDETAQRPLRPSTMIAVAWHEFILHTKVYEAYCLSRYGHFIHHTPGNGRALRHHAL